MLPLQSAIGLFALVGLAWLVRDRSRTVIWRPVIVGIGLTFLLAALLLKVPFLRNSLSVLNDAMNVLTDATHAGSSFVFGYLGGATLPFDVNPAGSPFIFAFQALPIILVVGALSALLFHWHIIQPVVRGFAWVLRRTIGLDGPAGVSSAMNIFVGMVESPLVVRPYLRRETRAGLFVIMTAGMASSSGSVLVLYATILSNAIPNALGQLIAASIISAPSAVAVAFLMMPPDEFELKQNTDPGDVTIEGRRDGENAMAAIARGTLDGIQLWLNVMCMILVLVALVYMVNATINAVTPDIGGAPLTMQRIFGWVMAPLAWLLGIPWNEAVTAGGLLGTKTVLNEVIAYDEMIRLPEGTISPRTEMIMLYALCGFANFASLGTMIGGLAAMVPERRNDIAALAPKTLISGTLATCIAGAIVGILTWS
ncbi:MAG: NupC/NupG family nucleoside CNT transporter [Rhodospirillaceae bacterium]